ncbi:hypothetical protein B0H14DRAFT_3576817 [Mycena olivaceomarginata]|nr:hypothetical protein B0H14DRAFT_3576817 [Mycena olivaceomarginata]
MEAAQVQGLGYLLAKMVVEDPALRAVFPSIDPDKLVQLVLKLCTVHLERPTDELVPVVGQKTISKTGINAARRTKARNSGVQYPWLLPGFNESLSSFPKGYWQQSPSHTNLVESAHVASNKATKIKAVALEIPDKVGCYHDITVTLELGFSDHGFKGKIGSHF